MNSIQFQNLKNCPQWQEWPKQAIVKKCHSDVKGPLKALFRFLMFFNQLQGAGLHFYRTHHTNWKNGAVSTTTAAACKSRTVAYLFCLAEGQLCLCSRLVFGVHFASLPFLLVIQTHPLSCTILLLHSAAVPQLALHFLCSFHSFFHSFAQVSLDCPWKLTLLHPVELEDSHDPSSLSSLLPLLFGSHAMGFLQWQNLHCHLKPLDTAILGSKWLSFQKSSTVLGSEDPFVLQGKRNSLKFCQFYLGVLHLSYTKDQERWKEAKRKKVTMHFLYHTLLV